MPTPDFIFNAKLFFFLRKCASLCVFYQIEPLGLFMFNKEEALGSGTAESSTVAAYSLALSD